MSKKITALVTVLVVVLGVSVISARRSRMLSQPLTASGGLGAVSSDGATISSPTTDAATALSENTAAQRAGEMNVLIALNPYPPVGFEPADFEVTLTDADGQAINDASVNLDLTMPGMWMPPNQLTLTPASDGKYSATGRFTMRGLWRIEVTITRGAETQSVFFDIWL